MDMLADSDEDWRPGLEAVLGWGVVGVNMVMLLLTMIAEAGHSMAMRQRSTSNNKRLQALGKLRDAVSFIPEDRVGSEGGGR